MPEDYNVDEINIKSVILRVYGFSIPAELSPIEICDYNHNNIPDFLVKFDRQSVQDACETGTVEMTLSLQTNDGTIFEGSNTIFVIDEGQGHKSKNKGSVVY